MDIAYEGQTIGFRFGPAWHDYGAWGQPYELYVGWVHTKEEWERAYKHGFSLTFRPWRSWFVWEQNLLTVERGEPVYQVRIHSFFQWPMKLDRW